MKTLNNTIATTPFPKNTIQAEKTAGGFSYVGNYVTLTALEVLYGNERIPAGSIVHVSSRDYLAPWAKTLYKFNDRDIMIVPEGSIVLLDTP
jgi:hypothetical protein